MGRKQRAEGEPILIKKYANRRLYNTAASRYVTLDQLAELIQAGEEFVVQDAKTGEDLTHSVLTQIIFDKEGKDKKQMLPLPFLRQLISFYGDRLENMIPGYLQSAMDALSKNQDKFRSAFNAGKPTSSFVPLFEDVARQNMMMFQETMKMFSPGGAARGGKAASDAQKDAEIAALKEELASLKAKVDALGD